MKKCGSQIPPIIHYCWFGGRALPESAQKCIASWEKYFPDYEIKEWNESNYDAHKIPYIHEAYNAKKYAFVSDYARFDILYQHGGIYFDIDVEALKPFDRILENGGFMGFETNGCVNPGLGVGCASGENIVRQILELYGTLRFLNTDGSYNERTVVEYITAILKKNGLKEENAVQKLDGFTIYPIDYFNPKNFVTGNIMITANTYSIHHFAMSWFSELDIFLITRRRNIIARLGNNIPTRALLFVMNFVTRCGKIGVKNTLSYYIKRYIVKKGV
jgi:hypothetical protein